jgi:transporter family-2 protein
VAAGDQRATAPARRHPLTATLVNFIGGTAILAVAALAHVAVVGAPAAWPTDPWLYLGGVIGVTYIFLSAALVVHTGVLILGLERSPDSS